MSVDGRVTVAGLSSRFGLGDAPTTTDVGAHAAGSSAQTGAGARSSERGVDEPGEMVEEAVAAARTRTPAGSPGPLVGARVIALRRYATRKTDTPVAEPVAA